MLFNRSFQGSAITLLPSPTSVKIIVYITVAVQNPGVYQINPQSRVEALIELAGGLVPSADQTQINLAAKLYDGQHLIIPSQTEDLDNRIIDDKHPLNVNSATLSELDLLPGIGEAKAQAIIAYRDRNGLFSKIEDIMLVPGIGVNLFNQIKSFITVSDIIP